MHHACCTDMCKLLSSPTPPFSLSLSLSLSSLSLSLSSLSLTNTHLHANTNRQRSGIADIGHGRAARPSSLREGMGFWRRRVGPHVRRGGAARVAICRPRVLALPCGVFEDGCVPIFICAHSFSLSPPPPPFLSHVLSLSVSLSLSLSVSLSLFFSLTLFLSFSLSVSLSLCLSVSLSLKHTQTRARTISVPCIHPALSLRYLSQAFGPPRMICWGPVRVVQGA